MRDEKIVEMIIEIQTAISKQMLAITLDQNVKSKEESDALNIKLTDETESKVKAYIESLDSLTITQMFSAIMSRDIIGHVNGLLEKEAMKKSLHSISDELLNAVFNSSDKDSSGIDEMMEKILKTRGKGDTCTCRACVARRKRKEEQQEDNDATDK